MNQRPTQKASSNLSLLNDAESLLSNAEYADPQLQKFDQLLNSLYASINDEAGFNPFLQQLLEHFHIFSAALAC